MARSTTLGVKLSGEYTLLKKVAAQESQER